MSNAATQTQYVVTLEVPAQRAEELAQWLVDEWDLMPVQLARPGSERSWLEIYFSDKREAQASATALAQREGVFAVQIRRCEPRDWLSFWRLHFHPHDIGNRLHICPVWQKPAGPKGKRKTILVDPGPSFGTGDHFTTRFCLEMIDRLSTKAPPMTMLDVGTGSGILAIAAAKLGCPDALGVDNDEMALTQAVRNIRLNRVTKQVGLDVVDINDRGFKRRFDLVCANIVSQVLIDVAPKLVRATKRHLVLSGIREHEVDAVADVYMAHGGREVVRDGDGEWAGIMLAFGKK